MLAVAIMVTTGTHIVKTHLLEIQNDGTGTWEVGNYDVQLKSYEVNEEIKTTRVEGHTRADGALKLVQKAIEAVIE